MIFVFMTCVLRNKKIFYQIYKIKMDLVNYFCKLSALPHHTKAKACIFAKTYKVGQRYVGRKL